MGRLNSLGLVTLALNYNLTIVGKIWITVMVVFRLLVIIGVGYPLYQDEQTKFTCDTMQPGCSNVCYDAFFPISHCRFWFVQATALCLPLAMFIMYVAHRVPTQNAKESSLQCPQSLAETSSIRKVPVGRASLTRKSSETNFHLEGSHGETKAVNEEVRIRQRILNFCEAYVLQLLLRTLLEVGFGVGQYYLFGFFVPNKFVCSSYPCANRVTCYPSRPTEKTLLVNFMFGVTAFSLLLNFVDLIYVIKQAVKQSKKNKLKMKSFYHEESYHDIPSDTRELPEHKLVQEYEMRARERRESVASSCSEAKSCKSGQEEGTFTRSEVQSEDVALSNTNSNNTHLTTITSSSAFMGGSPDRSGSKLVLCDGEQETPARSFSRCTDQQGSRLRQHALPNRPAESPSSNNQLLEYRLVHMRVTDCQSNCSKDSRRKKSEWV
ncbi:gap junction delta-4 protein [Carcharodon carcharias]|uniref:gap junction delta-4 protein n=1 Tax=Carcharodon carcharias TaxID=13397 RepID=UPI001B7DE34A|nr:gap junction delta-4 protein [Carcharodon carcharias]